MSEKSTPPVTMVYGLKLAMLAGDVRDAEPLSTTGVAVVVMIGTTTTVPASEG